MNKFTIIVSFQGFLMICLAFIFFFMPGIIDSPLSNIGQLKIVITAFIIAILFIYGLKAFRISDLDRSEVPLDIGTELEKAEDSDEDLKIQFRWQEEEDARKEMRQTVKLVLVEQHGFSEEEADRAIEKGEWTPDGVAAAMVEKDIGYPLFERLKEWLEEDGTYKRRIRRTIKSVEKLHEDDKK